jgi:hypothetical protein
MCIEKANTTQILVKRSCCLVANMPSNARLVNDFQFEFFSRFRMEKSDSTKVVFANDVAKQDEKQQRAWYLPLIESLGTVEHYRVILCVDVLLQFNLDSIVLNQLHVISFHILNLTRWPKPWQMGATWIQDVMNEIPWTQMNKLGKHYLWHFLVGVLL